MERLIVLAACLTLLSVIACSKAAEPAASQTQPQPAADAPTAGPSGAAEAAVLGRASARAASDSGGYVLASGRRAETAPMLPIVPSITLRHHRTRAHTVRSALASPL